LAGDQDERKQRKLEHFEAAHRGFKKAGLEQEALYAANFIGALKNPVSPEHVQQMKQESERLMAELRAKFEKKRDDDKKGSSDYFSTASGPARRQSSIRPRSGRTVYQTPSRGRPGLLLRPRSQRPPTRKRRLSFASGLTESEFTFTF